MCEEVLLCFCCLLEEMVVGGVEIMILFFLDLLEEVEFVNGDYYICWLEDWLVGWQVNVGKDVMWVFGIVELFDCYVCGVFFMVDLCDDLCIYLFDFDECGVLFLDGLYIFKCLKCKVKQ